MKKEIVGCITDFSLPSHTGRCPNAATVSTASENSAASARATLGHATPASVILPVRGQGKFDWSRYVRL